jgi:solute carrier family 50 protein (sugar transporter)
MMNYSLHLGAGILGAIFALLMYGASISTFKRVIKKRSTENFSGFPYAIALFNCLLYTWYGSPLISNGWDNAVVMAVNGIGLVLELCFVCIYLTFAPPKSKRNMTMMVVGLLVVFGIIIISSFCAVHDDKQRKILVGTAGMVATVVLYGSPLSVIGLVIKTKSVEFMPSFYFSLFVFLGSALWMVYGVVSKDIIIMAPNFLGLPLGLGQMILYCIYRRKRSPRVEAAKVDAGEELKSIKQNTEDIKSSTEDIEIKLEIKIDIREANPTVNSPQNIYP